MTHPDDVESHFETFSARQFARELVVQQAGAASNNLTAAKLISYARREDSAFDFVIEKELRSNPIARQIHDQALKTIAMDWSEMANAAAGGAHVVRKVGSSRVELIEEDEGTYLVLHLGRKKRSPTAIEVRRSDGTGARLALATPVGGIIQMRLDLSRQEPEQIRLALLETDSAVFLI